VARTPSSVRPRAPITGSITGRDTNLTSKPKCLGFIGGLGVGATVHYYQELVKAHAARACVPNLVMIHAHVNRVLQHAAAGETTQLAEYLSQLIHRLARAGAELAVILPSRPISASPSSSSSLGLRSSISSARSPAKSKLAGSSASLCLEPALPWKAGCSANSPASKSSRRAQRRSTPSTARICNS
jgi:hypothetical protein